MLKNPFQISYVLYGPTPTAVVMVNLFIVGWTIYREFQYELRQWRHQLYTTLNSCRPRREGSVTGTTVNNKQCGWAAVKFFSFLIFVIEADDLPDLTAGLSSLSNATSPIKFFTKIGRVVLTRRVLADRQTKDLLANLAELTMTPHNWLGLYYLLRCLAIT